MMADAGKAIAELQELRKLTGDGNGAQRVAWGPVWWLKARSGFCSSLKGCRWNITWMPREIVG